MDLDINAKGAVSQFFDALVIRQLMEQCVPPIWEGDIEFDRDLGIPKELVRRPGGLLKLWFLPDGQGQVKPGRYAIGGDIGAGAGATNSCLSIGDADLGEKIGEFASPFMDPKQLAPLAVALAWMFIGTDNQGALLAWEIPGCGQSFGTTVTELGYRNVFYRDQGEFTLTPRESQMPGWVNHGKSQEHLLTEYRAALRRGEFVNRSEDALEECLAFKYNSEGAVVHSAISSPNNPSGARTNHSDMAMADAILHKMLKKLGQTSREKKAEGAAPGSMQYRMNLRKKKLQEEEMFA